MRKLLLMLTAMGLLLVAARAEPNDHRRAERKGCRHCPRERGDPVETGAAQFHRDFGATAGAKRLAAEGRHSAWWFGGSACAQGL